MSGLPTPQPSPPLEHKSHVSKKQLSKPTKSINRSSKRSNSSQEHTSVVLDGRHKRVWKACERCRMKKTKCDGESPCKRCKDDGLVCTAGSRKKTEFKQLPRGYAEVLENTQYALIATVQKLYTMVRNGESWELGDPEFNDRGQPVIHDIASKLGCIRPSPDLPYAAFPEGEQDFVELQAQLSAARPELLSEDNGSRKYSEDSTHSPLQRTDRASSSESDHSSSSQDNKKWAQQQITKSQAVIKPAPLTIAQRPSFEEEVSYESRLPLGIDASLISPMYTDSQIDSPMFGNASPFSSWSYDDCLGSSHPLGLTANFIRQQENIPRSSPISRQNDFDAYKRMQMNDGFNFGTDGTVEPVMLNRSKFDMPDQVDNMRYNMAMDYDYQMGMTA